MKLKRLGLLTLASTVAMAAPPEKGERDRAMSYLHATRKQFLDAIRGVSPEQAKWKAAPERWSVAEVAEHIAVSEEFIFQVVTDKILKTPPATDAQKAAAKGKDATVISEVPDRTHRFQAPEPIMPAGKYASLAETAKAFTASRDKTIRFIETTELSLRDHIVPHPVAKELDAYQWILLIAAHSERHLKQLQEVKNSPGYPAR